MYCCNQITRYDLVSKRSSEFSIQHLPIYIKSKQFKVLLMYCMNIKKPANLYGKFWEALEQFKKHKRRETLCGFKRAGFASQTKKSKDDALVDFKLMVLMLCKSSQLATVPSSPIFSVIAEDLSL